MADERGKRTAKINLWQPTPSQMYVQQDGKTFVCNFSKVIHEPELEKYDHFYIKKASYENQLDLITHDINFFINWYDTDQELVNAYLKIKFETDEKHTFTPDNMDAYISFLYEILFTDTIVEKINRLVDDNYLDDIEVDSDEKRKKYQKNEKKHLESLEFTNQHIKILLRISFAMKMMCPAMFHYHVINMMKIEKDSDNIFRFYKPLFDIFGIVKKYTDIAYYTTDGYFYVYYDATQYFDKYDVETRKLVMCNVSSKKVQEKLENGELRLDSANYIAEYNMYNKLFVYVNFALAYKAFMLQQNLFNCGDILLGLNYEIIIL